MKYSLFGNVHRLMLVIKVSSPPQLHLTYSQATGRHEQLALCIYSIFVSYPTRRNSPAALYAQIVPSGSRHVPATQSSVALGTIALHVCRQSLSSPTNLLSHSHSRSCYFIHFSKSHFMSFFCDQSDGYE